MAQMIIGGGKTEWEVMREEDKPWETLFFFKILFILERHTERSRDASRGRSRLHAGSLTWDSIRVSRIIPWAEGGAKPLSHLGCPEVRFLTLNI